MLGVFTHRIRGFRVLDLVGVGVLVVLILGVYLFKTVAGRERSEIATVDRAIKAEKARIRLLQAEVAHLEQPGRVERLAAVYLGYEPVSMAREATPEQLTELAAKGPPPKDKAFSAVAGMVDGGDVTPGVPPPPPAEGRPLQVAATETVKP